MVTQNPTFQTATRVEGTRIHLVVSGSIDERSDFGPAQETLTKARDAGVTEAVFDLSGVYQLNSIGVKKWMSFLEANQSLFKLRFSKISEMIVAQANVISSMLGPAGTPIDSFSAPYICDQCKKEFSRELKRSDLTDGEEGDLSAPKLPCPACGGSLTFDEYEDEYFFFLIRSQGA